MKPVRSLLAVSALLALAAQAQAAQPDANAPPPEMGVFITSVGLGKGGDLGGLAGADAHCQALATAVDMGHRTWRAYLSTQGEGAVNAIDRIGNGPWANAKGVIMATNLESLKYDNSNFNWEHMLDEKGNQFSTR
ncbi:MAG: lectin, partial [Gammaproteobacteria bacterium]